MFNKLSTQPARKPRKPHLASSFSVNFGRDSPTTHPLTTTRLIDIALVPVPDRAPIRHTQDFSPPCNRSACLHIRNTPPKMPPRYQQQPMTPSMVNIVLEDKNTGSKSNAPSIHSSQILTRTPNQAKDMLKQYKKIEFMQRQLKRRNQQLSQPPKYTLSFKRHTSSQCSQHSEGVPPPNPEYSPLKAQASTALSRRYSKMLKRYVNKSKEANSQLASYCRGKAITPSKK